MVGENISRIRSRISSACARVDRDPDSILVVAVTKERQPEQVLEVFSSGIFDIGENKVQSAVSKMRQIPLTSIGSPIKWHMLGHLQTNKAKAAVRIFDLIHSLDSLHLAEEINKEAEGIGKVQEALVQVNTSGEETKFGLSVGEAEQFILEARQFKNIRISGLMTIAPLVDDPEKVRLYFRRLRELREKFNDRGTVDYRLRLSMGMSDDFEVAIEEGADIVRLGRAIFEG